VHILILSVFASLLTLLLSSPKAITETMRLPYAPKEPPADSPPSVADIYARIAARRRPRPLIPLDLTLLHSPPVANGYNAFVSALRTETIVPQSLLELAVCRVAILTTAVYEWNIHAALALKAGLSPQALEMARSTPPKGFSTTTAAVESSNQKPSASEPETQKQSDKLKLAEKEIAVLGYTDEATLDVRVQDTTFEHLKTHFNDREILELVTMVAGYNMVSRILVPLDVGENNDKAMKTVQELVAETGVKS
jgi:alkylhydroperoxidase family enzyme